MSARRLVLALLIAAAVAGCAGEDAGRADRPAQGRRGAARLSRPFGAAVNAKAAREDEAYLRAFVSTFTSMTPENEMKWALVHPERDRYAFADADALVGLARGTGKRVRGHTLVWEQQLPKWVTEPDWKRLSSAASSPRTCATWPRTTAGASRSGTSSTSRSSPREG